MSISTHSLAQQSAQPTRTDQAPEVSNLSAMAPKTGRLAGDFPKGAEDFLPERLHERWEFRPEGQATWEPVSLPSTFESHQGVGFDGVGWYRKRFPRILTTDSELRSKRLVLRFHGVATRATLWCDGKQVAEHLGGWTPFECDITDFVLRPRSGQQTPEGSKAEESPGALQDCEVLLKVDELVGHNSQGFLPVFAPHFGGIWKPIEAYFVDPVWIDTKELFVWGEPS
ncbi:MAG: sugar-binding domain-containing protein, partial [Pirellula sp.]